MQHSEPAWNQPNALTRGEWPSFQAVSLQALDFQLNRGLHFVCRIDDVALFQKYLRRILPDGDPSGTSFPRVTTGAIFDGSGQPDGEPVCPEIAFNLCLTNQGLSRVLGLTGPLAESMNAYLCNNFPAYQEGAYVRMRYRKPRAVDSWEYSYTTEAGAHVVLTVHYTGRYTSSHSLEEQLFRDSGLELIKGGKVEAGTLPGGREHFGQLDGISLPWIQGGPPPPFPGHGEATQPWVLVVRDFYRGLYSLQHPMDAPWLPPSDQIKTFNKLARHLFLNGSFAAFFKFEQDVPAFRDYLIQASLVSGKSNDWVSSRLFGRWPNGSPVVTCPDAPKEVYDLLGSYMEGSLPLDKKALQDKELRYAVETINEFDYAGGLPLCPVGAHIRRANPRNSIIAGRSDLRRLIRQRMNYGPVFNAELPYAPEKRGMVGYFLCSMIRQQFETVFFRWLLTGRFAGLVDQQRDPIVGNSNKMQENDLSKGGTLTVPLSNQQNMMLRGIPQFVIQRGLLYVFFPSIKGLRFLADFKSEDWS
ncbi:MAG: hypothetical protein QNK37_09775 [Acidobacteriota bacterium]|nr:hypothetical protein [Acidobacteriota bacterium]